MPVHALLFPSQNTDKKHFPRLQKYCWTFLVLTYTDALAANQQGRAQTRICQQDAKWRCAVLRPDNNVTAVLWNKFRGWTPITLPMKNRFKTSMPTHIAARMAQTGRSPTPTPPLQNCSGPPAPAAPPLQGPRSTQVAASTFQPQTFSGSSSRSPPRAHQLLH